MSPHLSDKERILQYAHQKFVSKGFYKTSIDELANDLHVSKKTIYKYFSSKSHLLEEVVNTRIKIIHDALDDIVESDEDTITKFLKILSMQKTYILNCGPEWFRDLSIHEPNLKRKMDKVRQEKITKIMTRLLGQGRREKVMENFPPEVVITALNGAIESVTNAEFIYTSKYSYHEAMRLTAEMFLNGIFTSKGRRKYSNTRKMFEKILK